MRLIDEHTGLEYIPADECLRLLAGRAIGRVGLVAHGRPVILPVNYVVDEGTIVFRTDEGLKFDAARRGEFVCFQVDEVDPVFHTGWSVLLSGVAREICDREEVERARTLPLRPWAPGAKSHFIRIFPRTITGRRIRFGTDQARGRGRGGERAPG